MKVIPIPKFIDENCSMRFTDNIVDYVDIVDNRYGLKSINTRLEFNNVRRPKFRETAEHFTTEDMTLVTKNGVYPNECTNECES